MKTGKETRRAARKLFRDCCPDGRMNDGRVRTAVSAVIAAKPRHYRSILALIEKFVRFEIEKRTLLIESAVPMDNAQTSDIQAKVQKRFTSPLIATQKQNPRLIGGLRIKVGSDVWDGSIAARLSQLTHA